MEEVILVDENDNKIGTSEKIHAHKEAKLHRAFSVFVFNSNNELLLQKRSEEKYHCPSLWSNTCCSHPKPGESIEQAAHRRLKEEMGFDCELKEVFSFIYKVAFDNGLTEHELDHVFIGRYDGKVKPDENEVAAIRWADVKLLRKDMDENTGRYTYWLKLILERVFSQVKD